MNMEFEKRQSVSKRTAQPRSTLYDRIGKGQFVPPIRNGEYSAVWIREEVDAIMAAQAKGASVDEVKVLVAALVKARTA